MNAETLKELALNLRWSWNHSTDELWKRLDPILWDLTSNPWLILQTIARDKLDSELRDPVFAERVSKLLWEHREALKAPSWFREKHAGSGLTTAAYFSMEFMLTEGLPIYSGGLGNVAGDQLKAASNLGVPVIGVGLLYAQGYFRQEIDSDGRQIALYPFNDPGQLPIMPLREPNGEWLRFQIDLAGPRKLWVRAWEVLVGRAKLYLLDTNDPANAPSQRSITSELYGGGPELRLKQELVLGIGGWRLLRAMGIDPEVCHMNEGHTAFTAVERARTFMQENRVNFWEALTTTRAGNIFTTHTAVEAGFDRFPPDLIEKYLRRYAQDELGVSLDDLTALGRLHRGNSAEPFNMAYLALRCSGAVNAVSRLHGEVSRKLFQPLFQRWPAPQVPVGHITNGVHMPTWDSAESNALWTKAVGELRWYTGDHQDLPVVIGELGDAALWHLRQGAKKSLIENLRAHTGEPELFDPNVLTLGFARRFATYKRPNLLLRDPERLVRILKHDARPVQILVAGKAHPEDLAGQELIQQWTLFARRPDVSARVVFIPDYDMLITQMLVQGVDLWINTPRRPWEASGTSGMKLLANGGLNLSELDGWWAEAYTPDVGWALGDGREHGEDPGVDAAEAEALYSLLERDIAPEFYTRDERGIPVRWVAKMRESMARLTPAFSASRTVRDYTENHYLPAAESYKKRAASQGKLGVEIHRWERNLDAHWSGVRFGEVSVAAAGDKYRFSAKVSAGDLQPGDLRVELYAEPDELWPMAVQDGKYVAEIPATRPAGDYTARVISYHSGASVPLECARILWQR